MRAPEAKTTIAISAPLSSSASLDNSAEASQACIWASPSCAITPRRWVILLRRGLPSTQFSHEIAKRCCLPMTCPPQERRAHHPNRYPDEPATLEPTAGRGTQSTLPRVGAHRASCVEATAPQRPGQCRACAAPAPRSQFPQKARNHNVVKVGRPLLERGRCPEQSRHQSSSAKGARLSDPCCASGHGPPLWRLQAQAWHVLINHRYRARRHSAETSRYVHMYSYIEFGTFAEPLWIRKASCNLSPGKPRRSSTRRSP